MLITEVLIRFRLGKYACLADLSRCFFQVKVPRSQQDLFRIVWFNNNDIVKGETKVYRFTRHVWGINSSPYIALLAIQSLVNENPTCANKVTLDALINNRYQDDMLFSSDSFAELQVSAREAINLFESRGFKLRKWIANSLAKDILMTVPHCDLALNVGEIDLALQPLPNSKALGLTWDTENDKLLIAVEGLPRHLRSVK